MFPTIMARIRSLRPYYEIEPTLEDDMIEKLFAGVTEASHMGSMTDLMGSLYHIANTLEDDYFKDHNLKDAAIDALCQILQQHKTPKV